MNFSELRTVDGLSLPDEHRALLRPGEPSANGTGIVRHLPRFFFEVPSWSDAKKTRIAQHFRLSELTMVDCRESDLLLQGFPHYVPCAIAVLARYLEDFRIEAGVSVYVAANGGYRSPAHQFHGPANTHHWATAADIYRVGDTYLNDAKSIEKYRRAAESLGSEVFAKPYCEGDDHLHFDVGFLALTPRTGSETG